MKFSVFTIMFLLIGTTSCDTSGTKFEKNAIRPSSSLDQIAHIRKNSLQRKIDDELLVPEYFVDYVIENLIERPEHIKYITDRQLLRKLENKVCWDSHVQIKDTLYNGDHCSIDIKFSPFVKENHVLKYQDKSGFLIEVDGKYPYGAVYSEQPNMKIKSLEIRINDKMIETALHKYNNHYEVNCCNFGAFTRKIEAYEDGDNLYIYLYGGGAAGTYFSKLIFDNHGFVTSITTDYEYLSEYGSFGEHFIGY